MSAGLLISTLIKFSFNDNTKLNLKGLSSHVAPFNVDISINQLCFMNSENIESFEAPLALFVSHIALWLLFFL